MIVKFEIRLVLRAKVAEYLLLACMLIYYKVSNPSCIFRELNLSASLKFAKKYY